MAEKIEDWAECGFLDRMLKSAYDGRKKTIRKKIAMASGEKAESRCGYSAPDSDSGIFVNAACAVSQYFGNG